MTEFEKQMITLIHERIERPGRRDKKASDKAAMETLIKGTDSEKQALIRKFINEEGLIAEVTTQISALNARGVMLNALKANMSAYVSS